MELAFKTTGNYVWAESPDPDPDSFAERVNPTAWYFHFVDCQKRFNYRRVRSPYGKRVFAVRSRR